MRKKVSTIPVNSFDDEHNSGIVIERIDIKNLPPVKGGEESHRHDRHSFFLLEKGTVSMEIDFQQYNIKPLSILYMHPNQVHRMLVFENVTVSTWAINNENLNPAYLELLEDIAPAKPLVLDKATFSMIAEAVSLFIKCTEKNNGGIYHSLRKDSCNTLVALAAAQFLERAGSGGKVSRFETVTRAFRKILDRNYTTDKRPIAYAQKLNISTPYLNECVRNTTGYSVSHHIQQRVVLEAKRLLHYSDKSIKEIAAELGYDDYPYFSRLFTKVTGMTAAAFRNKNLD